MLQEYGFLIFRSSLSVILSIKETVDRRQLDKRLNCIEKSISELEKNIYHESPSRVTSFFTSQISGLNSHDYYSFRRNIRFLIADAQPEVVDTFVSALLHFLHDEDVRHSMDEEVMDILLQFNAHDIDLMERIPIAVFVARSGMRNRLNYRNKLKT